MFELAARKILAKHPVNLERKSKKLLPANAILTREPGQVNTFPKLKHPYGLDLSGICVSGDETIHGIAKVTGMNACKTREMTANLDTDLNKKFELTAKLLKQYDVVVLHVKGCDIAAHNKDAEKKKKFLERIDTELGRFLGRWSGKLRLCITADHTTCSKEGVHTDDPVPVLLHGSGISADSVREFDEIQASKGQLGRFRMYKLLEKFFV